MRITELSVNARISQGFLFKIIPAVKKAFLKDIWVSCLRKFLFFILLKSSWKLLQPSMLLHTTLQAWTFKYSVASTSYNFRGGRMK